MEAHNKEKVDPANQRIRELSGAFEFCHYVAVQDLFESGDHHVIVRDEAQILYLDDDHLSQAGVQKAKERLKQTIVTLIKE